jgi:hypothetical protein
MLALGGEEAHPLFQIGSSGGSVSFGFALACSERCRFELASSGRVLGEFWTGDEDDKTYNLREGNYTLLWTFTTHRLQGDSLSKDHAIIRVSFVVICPVQTLIPLANACLRAVYHSYRLQEGRGDNLQAVQAGNVQSFRGRRVHALSCRFIQVPYRTYS